MWGCRLGLRRCGRGDGDPRIWGGKGEWRPRSHNGIGDARRASSSVRRVPETHLALLTFGGPNHCGRLATAASAFNAIRICPVDTKHGVDEEGNPFRDWGDPVFLAQVAKLPATLRHQGVRISKLVLIGASYGAYDVAELAATHPELKPTALIHTDSFFDLPSRYRALPQGHQTQKSMKVALGGTLEQRPAAYAARSPSNHLDALAALIRGGMHFVVGWTASPTEKREFRGATCSLDANAKWIAKLSGRLGGPIAAHVTTLPHGDLLRYWSQHSIALAGIGGPFTDPMPGRVVVFHPDAPVLAGSYC